MAQGWAGGRRSGIARRGRALTGGEGRGTRSGSGREQGLGQDRRAAGRLEHFCSETAPLQWRAVHDHLVPAPVPLVLAHLLAEGALDAGRAGVHVHDVLFQVELVGKEAVTYGADARLARAPQPTAPVL